MSISSSSSCLDSDPLLKELTEKRLSIKKNVASVAAELKNARHQLTLQELSFARERHTRMVIETKARSMEEEIDRLKACSQEKDYNLQASMIARQQQYLKELDDMRSQLSATQDSADASAAAAQSVQTQCINLSKVLHEKEALLLEHEERVTKLEEQLNLLRMDLHASELSQKLMNEELMRVKTDIMHAIEKARTNQDCELRKMLAEILPKFLENNINLLTSKDEKMAKLRDEIRSLSNHSKHDSETLELQEQFDKQRNDQEMEKRMRKIDFCLQEVRTQTRKLQMMEEKRDNAITELRDKLDKKNPHDTYCNKKKNFWQSSDFKILVSMSMLFLIVLAKRRKARQTGCPLGEPAGHKRSWRLPIPNPLLYLSQINILKTVDI